MGLETVGKLWYISLLFQFMAALVHVEKYNRGSERDAFAGVVTLLAVLWGRIGVCMRTCFCCVSEMEICADYMLS